MPCLVLHCLVLATMVSLCTVPRLARSSFRDMNGSASLADEVQPFVFRLNEFRIVRRVEALCLNPSPSHPSARYRNDVVHSNLNTYSQPREVVVRVA